MRILFVSNHIATAPKGAKTLALAHYKLLCELYGKDNIDLLSLKTFAYHDDDHKYESICSLNNKYEMLGNAFFGRPIFINKKSYEHLLEQAQNVDIIFFDNYVYGYAIDKIKRSMDVKVVAFFHGIYAVEGRIWRKNEKRSIWGDYLFFNELVSEKKTIEKSDRIIMLNVRDENEAYEIYKRKADLLLPMFIEDTANIVESDCDSNEFRILFVGGFFGPNVEGIRWFAQRVMPLLDDRYHLYIVGNGMEELRNEQLMQKNNIHIIGRVDDLSEWYNSSECVIGPIFYGDGMKTKTAEALMYGKIFLGTEEAICGYDELANYQCDTETEFATAIKKVCKKNGSKYHQDMRDIYLSRYSIDAVKQQVGDLLEGLLK